MRSVLYNGKLKLLNQIKLPNEEWVEINSVDELILAIKRMIVRGAPAIGVAAAYGMAISKDPIKDAELLKKSRPTAVDLFHAVDFMLENGANLENAKKWDMINDEKCKKVSENGASLIEDGFVILTHCNTGFAASNSYGTAIGAIRMAHEKGKKIFVYATETRPRFQGVLTSYELLKFGIPHKIICDSAVGSIIDRIDCVMVGADRIAQNGDTANKIGTYQLSLLAKEHGKKFYVLAPTNTIDYRVKNGKEIPIEERDKNEILNIMEKRIYPIETEVFNPSFDVTPAKNITAYITENGIIREFYAGVKFEYIIKNENIPDCKEFLEIDNELGKYIKPFGNEGNLSMIIDNGFLIKGSGSILTKLEKKDISFVTFVGKMIEVNGVAPSSETRMHYEIYKNKPEAKIVLHFHNDELLKKNWETIGPLEYGTEEQAIHAGKTKTNRFIIKNHGLVLIAKNKEELIEMVKECVTYT